MPLTLPPDPNDIPDPSVSMTGAGQFSGAIIPPTAPPQHAAAYSAPVFPDGSRGAVYREPLVVTRRNNARVAMWVFGGVLTLVVFGGVALVFILLASGLLY